MFPLQIVREPLTWCGPMSPSPTHRTPSSLNLALLLGALAALGPLTIDMYLPSFPAIAESLGSTVAAVQLSLASYLAGLAVGQMVYGPLADAYGRRLPLLGGLALFGAATLVCAFAPTLGVLIGARFVQALGGCAGMVVSRAVVRDLFDARESAKLYSTLMLVMGVAPIIAPLLGAQVLLHVGWRAIFGVLFVAAGAVVVLILRFLPESLPLAQRKRRSPREVVRSFRTVLSSGTFVRLAIAAGAGQAVLFAYISGSPFVFIDLFGVSPQHYGWIFGANAAGLIALSQLNRVLVPRFGIQRTLTGALFVTAAGTLLLFTVSATGGGLPLLLPALFLSIASVGLVMPNATALAMAPWASQAGIASSGFGTLQIACGAVASALVSALANGTALPMTGVMLGCGVVGLVLVLWGSDASAAPHEAPSRAGG